MRTERRGTTGLRASSASTKGEVAAAPSTAEGGGGHGRSDGGCACGLVRGIGFRDSVVKNERSIINVYGFIM